MGLQSTSLYDRTVSFVVLLSPYHLTMKRLPSITPHVGLGETLKLIAPPSKISATEQMDPALLHARVPRDYTGHVLSLDGSVKTERMAFMAAFVDVVAPRDIEIAVSAYLLSTTVNLAEYTGMNNGVKAAIDRGVTDLVVVGNSRLAIQQCMGACKKETLQVELARHKELTKKLNSEFPSKSRVQNAESDTRILYTAGNITYKCGEGPTVQSRAVKFTESFRRRRRKENKRRYQQIRKIRLGWKARSEQGTGDLSRQPARRIEARGVAEFSRVYKETRLSGTLQGHQSPVILTRLSSKLNGDDTSTGHKMKNYDYLRYELSQLLFRRVRNAGKVAEDFVISEDGLLYRHNRSHRRGGDDELSLNLRLAVPATMVDEVLQNCHNSVEGGHQGIRSDSAVDSILPGARLGCAIYGERYDGDRQAGKTARLVYLPQPIGAEKQTDKWKSHLV
ncbi:LOW QUALITY PROTEIN: hypothetical protein PHPALM_31203 [Phytophthora palmivora]|uniref:RNase H type-1 domain-containing protein n=1 Tax=Phytophthora palmivora TaxID=4796 RepID=A0A2P4X362_9STRA|nr:LOW QUALITY PROTEIN: hypothetical protein PHPALM_31203 [Phytophthora palmivora]